MFVVDQVTKLLMATLEPASYGHNPRMIPPALTPWPFVAAMVLAVIPFRPVSIAYGLAVGGAAGNIVDSYLWPAGTPDFIPIGSFVINVADIMWYGFCAVTAFVVVIVWPIDRIATHRRRGASEGPRSERLG